MFNAEFSGGLLSVLEVLAADRGDDTGENVFAWTSEVAVALMFSGVGYGVGAIPIDREVDGVACGLLLPPTLPHLHKEKRQCIHKCRPHPSKTDKD